VADILDILCCLRLENPWHFGKCMCLHLQAERGGGEPTVLRRGVISLFILVAESWKEMWIFSKICPLQYHKILWTVSYFMNPVKRVAEAVSCSMGSYDDVNKKCIIITVQYWWNYKSYLVSCCRSRIYFEVHLEKKKITYSKVGGLTFPYSLHIRLVKQ
jgi:hypothetical protein